jgi:anti-anti-sigma factor
MAVFKLEEDTGIKKIRQFQSELRDAIRAQDEVMLDFTAVRRLDCAAIQVVLAAARELREASRSLKMRGVNEAIRNQLYLCGLQ